MLDGKEEAPMHMNTWMLGTTERVAVTKKIKRKQDKLKKEEGLSPVLISPGRVTLNSVPLIAHQAGGF